jgi:hypothetical protein
VLALLPEACARCWCCCSCYAAVWVVQIATRSSQGWAMTVATSLRPAEKSQARNLSEWIATDFS